MDTQIGGSNADGSQREMRVDRLTEREREGERVVDRRETKKEKGERVGIAGTWEKVL